MRLLLDRCHINSGRFFLQESPLAKVLFEVEVRAAVL